MPYFETKAGCDGECHPNIDFQCVCVDKYSFIKGVIRCICHYPPCPASNPGMFNCVVVNTFKKAALRRKVLARVHYRLRRTE